MSDPRRRFNRRQHNELYIAARGRCQNCDEPLGDGWHADHHTPWSKGGPTSISNGRALCPTCNLKKGNLMDYRDTFEPRPFQEGVIEKVVDGFATGRRVTVGLGTPGTGKTLSYQATATRLLREGLIDYIAVFAPRISLARQCEIDWMHQDPDTKELKGHFLLFDERLRFGKIRHVGTKAPFTQPGAIGTGFCTTYSALTTAEAAFLNWAEEQKGRFLLVADEAQFCGAAEGKDDGTRAGALIEQMSKLAAHTLLLTGTPYRADNQKLVLCEYSEAEKEDNGKAKLLRDVEATYAHGVDGEYLRQFEFQLVHGSVTEEDVAGSWSQKYSWSAKDVELPKVLRMPSTWQPMVDRVVKNVREKQQVNPQYRGLISCMEQKEAQAVANYLKERYPGLRVFVALSDDGKQGQDALQHFKVQPADLLVTVRMAFIGYDCKQITVVGVLTHYRHEGHLMQLIGRGLRSWDKEPFDKQSLRVVAPNDHRMEEFCTKLKAEEEEGLRLRREREAGGGDRDPHPFLSQIVDTEVEGVTGIGNEADVDKQSDFQFFEEVKARFGMVDDVTKLAAFADFMGMQPKNTEPDAATWTAAQSEPPAPSTPMTDAQQIAKIGRHVADEVRAYLSDRGVRAGAPGYGAAVSEATATVNRIAGFRANEARTVEQAQRRLDVIRRMRGLS